MEIFLVLPSVWGLLAVFSRYSVRIVLHVENVFLWCICGRSSMFFYSTIYFFFFNLFIRLRGVLVCFSPVVVYRLSCSAACRILVLQPGIKPASPELQGGFLTTRPPGKSLLHYLDSELLYDISTYLPVWFCIWNWNRYWNCVPQVCLQELGLRVTPWTMEWEEDHCYHLPIPCA